MMVEFFYAVITDRTMLGSGRFDKFTGFAIVVFLVQGIIVNVFFGDLFGLFLIFDYSWIVCASAIKAVVAKEHEGSAGDPIKSRKVWSRTILDQNDLKIDKKPSDNDYKIQNLNNWIRFPHYIDTCTIKCVDNSVS